MALERRLGKTSVLECGLILWASGLWHYVRSDWFFLGCDWGRWITANLCGALV